MLPVEDGTWKKDGCCCQRANLQFCPKTRRKIYALEARGCVLRGGDNRSIPYTIHLYQDSVNSELHV